MRELTESSSTNTIITPMFKLCIFSIGPSKWSLIHPFHSDGQRRRIGREDGGGSIEGIKQLLFTVIFSTISSTTRATLAMLAPMSPAPTMVMFWMSFFNKNDKSIWLCMMLVVWKHIIRYPLYSYPCHVFHISKIRLSLLCEPPSTTSRPCAKIAKYQASPFPFSGLTHSLLIMALAGS